MISQELERLAEELKKDIPKINGLAIISASGDEYKIILPNPLTRLQELCPAVSILSNSINEFTGYIDDGSIVYFRKLPTGDWMLATSKFPVSAFISLFLKSQDIELPKAEKSPSKPNEEVKAVETKIIIEDSTQEDFYKFELPTENKTATDEEKSVYRIQKRHLKNNSIGQFFSKYYFHFNPLKIVGGDFVWIREIDGKIYLILVDCQLTGSSGALLSLYLNSILEEYDYAKPIEFEQYFKWVRKRLSAHHLENIENEEEQLVDLGLGLLIIDETNHKISINTSGIAVIFIHEGQETFSSKQTTANQQVMFSLSSGDRIFLFTDGFIGLKEDNLSPIVNYLKEFQGKPLKEINITKVIPELQDDDTTCIGLEF